MQQGTVKWYNETKGYGFIIDDANEKDVFVHKTGLEGIRNLEPGQKVEFDIADGAKGPTAVQVKVI